MTAKKDAVPIVNAECRNDLRSLERKEANE